jgi:hypothetical protein
MLYTLTPNKVTTLDKNIFGVRNMPCLHIFNQNVHIWPF